MAKIQSWINEPSEILRGRSKDGRRGVSDVKMELLNEVTLANAVTKEYMKEVALTANDTPTVLINWVALTKKSMVPFFKIVIIGV